MRKHDITKKKRKTKKKVKRVYRTSSDKPWFLYILECGDLSLYTGIALDVEARLKKHSAGKGARYTSTHLPLTLKYVEECKDRKTAMLREIEVKKYSRIKKLALVQQGNSAR